jgi:hypothetical protein
MMTKLDSNDPESLHKFLQEKRPNAAKDAIRKAMVFGSWLLPKDQRTEDILEREIRPGLTHHNRMTRRSRQA